MTLILPVCLFYLISLSLSLSLNPSLLSHSSILCYYSHAWLVSGLIWKQGISLLLMGHRDLITTCHHYQLSCLAFSIIFPFCMYHWGLIHTEGLWERTQSHTLKHPLDQNWKPFRLYFFYLFSHFCHFTFSAAKSLESNRLSCLIIENIPRTRRHHVEIKHHVWNGIKTANWIYYYTLQTNVLLTVIVLFDILMG